MQPGEQDGEKQRSGSKDKHERDVTIDIQVARRGAGRVWNSNYRRCFEWEVFGQVEVEVKGSTFVWAVGLVVVPYGEWQI